MFEKLVENLERLKEKNLLVRVSLKTGNFLFGKIYEIDKDSNQIFIKNDRNQDELHIIAFDNISELVVWRIDKNEH